MRSFFGMFFTFIFSLTPLTHSLADDHRIREAVSPAYIYIVGSFGALIMVASGLGSILTALLAASLKKRSLWYISGALLFFALGAFAIRGLIPLVC